jgi:hypothetical protein
MGKVMCGLLVGIALATTSACGGGEEKTVQSLEAEDVVAYWSVYGKRNDTNYIHPIVRFKVRNGSEADADYIQTMAIFRLESNPNEAWGNDYQYAIAGDPIAPGELSREITLKSDSTFYSKDEPAKMIENEMWEQVNVEILLRVSSSSWRSVFKQDVPRRIGAPGLDKFLNPQDPEGQEEEGKNSQPSGS